MKNESFERFYEKIEDLFSKGFSSIIDEASKHSQPAKDTRQFMEETRVSIARIEERTKKTDENVSSLVRTLEKHIDSIEEMKKDNEKKHEEIVKESRLAIEKIIENSDCKYASKDVERWFKKIVGIIIVTVVLAVLALIIKK